ncbi:hypothetical protein [Hahella ganghwensis]|uniref:hypothetical protein n=1 Tax=Hahella ganghwensis TaxID=286420 RepID=UPI000370AC1C|nr:hypothetical protein [Hahella ganghwensis]
MTSVNRRTKALVSKRNEIITYSEGRELFVLGKSGGVSLFDAMSPKLKMGVNDCWFFLPKSAEIPSGIIIAKDVHPDQHGHFHDALQPEYDMPMASFKEKLAEIGSQMSIVL